LYSRLRGGSIEPETRRYRATRTTWSTLAPYSARYSHALRKTRFTYPRVSVNGISSMNSSLERGGPVSYHLVTASGPALYAATA
jgi:hypothetical protein